jgi:site-specific recombinase XerD
MRNENTFGLHFILRVGRSVKGKSPIYARISVNKTKCELALKCHIRKEDWNSVRGAAKTGNEELKLLNSYLEEVRGKLVKQYRALHITDALLTAESVKDAYLGINENKRKYTLLWVVAEHNLMMQKILKHGTMKNYSTTEKYLKAFIPHKFRSDDIFLSKLNYEFISGFEFYVRSNSIKENDPCANNGTMKHMERLKKMVNWAVKNEWLDKNPFSNFKLKFDRQERECLNEIQLTVIKTHDLENPTLQLIRDLFVFSCYTGLAYIDLIELKPNEIVTSVNGVKWIKTAREKSGVVVNIPLLDDAINVLDKYSNDKRAIVKERVFPLVSNQEMNRGLKVIAEICGIKKHLTFHLARHTFATTVTLMNGVPIETISKMLGHTKLSTTMIYARISQTKIGLDMELLQNRLEAERNKAKLMIVRQ